VYTGVTDGLKGSQSRKNVVMGLVKTYFGSWKGATVDNLFT